MTLFCSFSHKAQGLSHHAYLTPALQQQPPTHGAVMCPWMWLRATWDKRLHTFSVNKDTYGYLQSGKTAGKPQRAKRGSCDWRQVNMHPLRRHWGASQRIDLSSAAKLHNDINASCFQKIWSLIVWLVLLHILTLACARVLMGWKGFSVTCYESLLYFFLPFEQVTKS